MAGISGGFAGRRHVEKAQAAFDVERRQFGNRVARVVGFRGGLERAGNVEVVSAVAAVETLL